ncbi:MAG: putative lipid II flippase FtsW [Planctomycetes bacterium]|nr:putative lipid II flippase FtsW [Planctomycetota bacterium]
MLRSSHLVALTAIALLMIGVVMVNSATMAVTPVAADATIATSGVSITSVLFGRTTIYMLIAVMGMLICWRLPVRELARRAHAVSVPSHQIQRGLFSTEFKTIAFAAAFFIFLLGLAYVPGLQRVVNGSHRWIQLPIPGLGDALSVQPSEIAKWGMVILLAWFATRRAQVMHRFLPGLLPALVVLGLVCIAVVAADLGTGFLIFCAGCILLIAAGARIWHFLAFIPLGAMALLAAIMMSPYRVARITAFLDPYADPKGTGYHMIQSMLAVMNGEGFGRGLGFGIQKFGYLPEDQTDFIFAIICEELGIGGAFVVASLFGALIWFGIGIVRREKDGFLQLVALGIITTIAIQALINLAVVTGLGPTKGIALPLISNGGTGWLLTSMSLGLLMAIDRTQDQPLAEPELDTRPLVVG